VNSKGPTSTNGDFAGIWDLDSKNENIDAVAQELVNKLPEKGGQKPVKPWGIKSVIGNLLVLLITQIIVSGLLVWAVGSTLDDPADLTTALFASPWIIIGSSLSMYAVWVGGMFVTSYVKGRKSLKKDFWVSFKRFDVLIGLGVAAVLFGFVIGVQWLLGDVLGLDLTGSDNSGAFSALEGAWFFIVGIGIASILGPLSEELFFRGYLMQAIAKSIRTRLAKVNSEVEEGFSLRAAIWFNKYQYVFAAIISSVVFGFMHFQGAETFGQWLVVIITGTLGLVFAVMTIKFRRLGPAIFGHMFYNGATLMIAYFLS
jgi:membrane protease YdiL (CAAX protease family)